MIRAQLGDTVIIHYRLSFKDGRVFTQTQRDEPVKVQLGTKCILPGVEEAILGMAAGDAKTLTLSHEKAYGPRFNELIVTLEKSQVPQDVKTTPGSKIRITTKEGKEVDVVVVKETEDQITLDANPIQAGKDFILYVELLGFD